MYHLLERRPTVDHQRNYQRPLFAVATYDCRFKTTYKYLELHLVLFLNTKVTSSNVWKRQQTFCERSVDMILSMALA
jgi:hypothetical protein